jgi:hypothetical protein
MALGANAGNSMGPRFFPRPRVVWVLSVVFMNQGGGLIGSRLSPPRRRLLLPVESSSCCLRAPRLTALTSGSRLCWH